eukprot:gene10126-21110_t
MSTFYQKYLVLTKKSAGSLIDSSSWSDERKPLSYHERNMLEDAELFSDIDTIDPYFPIKTNQIISKRLSIDRNITVYKGKRLDTPIVRDIHVQFPKTEQARLFLKNTLSEHYLFSFMSIADMDRVIDSMQPLMASPGQIITKKGEFGDILYCIEAGGVEIIINDESIATYTTGECFGELSIIYNTAQTAYMLTTSSSLLWTLELNTFRNISSTTSSTKLIRLCEFLRTCSYLDDLSDEDIIRLAESVESKTYPPLQTIYQKGMKNYGFFIVQQGTLRLMKSCDCFTVPDTGVNLLSDLTTAAIISPYTTTHTRRYITTTETTLLFLTPTQVQMFFAQIYHILEHRMRLQILHTVPLLHRISTEKLSMLCRKMKGQVYSPNETIIHEGEIGDTFYLIESGEVKCTQIYKSMDINMEIEEIHRELIRLSVHEFFGEKALVENHPSDINIITLTTVRCLILKRQDFIPILIEIENECNDEINKRMIANNLIQSYREKFSNIIYDDLNILRTIGTGTFGRVKVVQHRYTGSAYVIKCLKFVQGGELWSYLYEKQRLIPRNRFNGFIPDVIQFYIANIIIILEFLHERNIAYRDLKPENLLIDNQGYIKLVDFGFAKAIPFVKNGILCEKTFTLCGTPEYLAPEIILLKGYDKAVDLWALGCLTYELYMTKTPFRAENTTLIFESILRIKNETIPYFPIDTNKHLESLVSRLLTVNPAFRIGCNKKNSMKDMRTHPFFTSLSWDGIENRHCTPPYIPVIANVLDSSYFGNYDEDTDITPYNDDPSVFFEF